MSFLLELRNNNIFLNYLEKYMILIVILNSIYFYFQAYKMYQDKNSENIPIFGVLIEVFVSINLILYGLIIKNKVIITAGIVNLIGSGSVLFLYLLYK